MKGFCSLSGSRRDERTGRDNPTKAPHTRGELVTPHSGREQSTTQDMSGETDDPAASVGNRR
jgi:hypothetical protein